MKNELDIDELVNQANLGSVDAMLDLADIYHEAPDYEKSFFWTKKAADEGNTTAIFNVAVMYRDGQGVNQDDNEYFIYMKQAAEASDADADAMYELSRCYDFGTGTQKDDEASFYWKKKSASLGDVDAMYNLALAYKDGIGTNINDTQFFYWMTKSAEAGDTDAIFGLGLAYELGHGTDVNIEKAVYWYKQGAAKGETSSIYNLAICYLKGKGVEKDLKEFFKLTTLAAENDDVSAMFNLALASYHAEGTEKDLVNSFEWMKKSAEKGHKSAINLLSSFYEKGIGTDKDENKYFEWLKKSVDEGEKENLVRLALAYQYGIGTDVDVDKFLLLSKLAVEKGLSKAFILLGVGHLQQRLNIGKEVFKEVYGKLDDFYNVVQETKRSHIVQNDIDTSFKIAHFTSLNALHSMLPIDRDEIRNKPNRLRLYNISYMNDPAEGRRLLEVNNNDGKLLSRFFEDISTNDGHHVIKWSDQELSIYAGSFTLSIDRLDLWRAYGNDGDGYCIVTPISAFDSHDDKESYSIIQHALRDVEHAEDVALPKNHVYPKLYMVQYTIDEAKKTLKLIRPNLKELDELKKKYKDIKYDINSMVRAIVSDILYLYKNDEYKTECEARIISAFDISADILNIDDNTPPRIYVTTNDFLFKEGSSIIVGPKVDKKTDAKLNLKYRLARNNFNLSTNISESVVKYR